MEDDDRAVVLVVDDIEDTVAMYADMLGAGYEIRTASSGAEALEEIDADVDVVLLDRQMPGLSGYEVVAAIRDRGHDTRIAMITASEPGFDIGDVDFDDYVVKPVSVDELRRVTASLRRRRTYDRQLREYFAVASKIGVLETNKTAAELEASDAYAELKNRLATIKDRVDAALAHMEAGRSGDGFRELL